MENITLLTVLFSNPLLIIVKCLPGWDPSAMIEQQISKKQANLIAIVLNALLFLIAICECFADK